MTTIKDILNDLAFRIHNMEIDHDEYHDEETYIQDAVNCAAGEISDLLDRVKGDL
jgi:hypothetical protein